MPLYSTCLLLLFLFRTNGKKGHLDESDFCHCYGNFFKTAILKVTWYQLYSKFLLINYKAHWQNIALYIQIYKNALENKCSDIFWYRISRIFFRILGYSFMSQNISRMFYIFLKCSRYFLKVFLECPVSFWNVLEICWKFFSVLKCSFIIYYMFLECLRQKSYNK